MGHIRRIFTAVFLRAFNLRPLLFADLILLYPDLVDQRPQFLISIAALRVIQIDFIQRLQNALRYFLGKFYIFVIDADDVAPRIHVQFSDLIDLSLLFSSVAPAENSS